MKLWSVVVGVALMGLMTVAQAQSMYDAEGHYLGQAGDVRGMTAPQVVQYRDAQDYNAYVQRAYPNPNGQYGGVENAPRTAYTPGYYTRPDRGAVVEVPVIRVNEIDQMQTYDAPQMQCQTVNVPIRQGGSTAGTLLGSVIGGVLGHQIGRGRGRTAATVGGAVLGGGVGYAATNSVTYIPQQRCYQTNGSRQVMVPRYEVTYLYPLPAKVARGKKLHIDPLSVHTVVMDHEPGRTMMVRLNTEVLN